MSTVCPYTFWIRPNVLQGLNYLLFSLGLRVIISADTDDLSTLFLTFPLDFFFFLFGIFTGSKNILKTQTQRETKYFTCLIHNFLPSLQNVKMPNWPLPRFITWVTMLTTGHSIEGKRSTEKRERKRGWNLLSVVNSTANQAMQRNRFHVSPQ